MPSQPTPAGEKPNPSAYSNNREAEQASSPEAIEWNSQPWSKKLLQDEIHSLAADPSATANPSILTEPIRDRGLDFYIFLQNNLVGGEINSDSAARDITKRMVTADESWRAVLVEQYRELQRHFLGSSMSSVASRHALSAQALEREIRAKLGEHVPGHTIAFLKDRPEDNPVPFSGQAAAMQLELDKTIQNNLQIAMNVLEVTPLLRPYFESTPVTTDLRDIMKRVLTGYAFKSPGKKQIDDAAVNIAQQWGRINAGDVINSPDVLQVCAPPLLLEETLPLVLKYMHSVAKGELPDRPEMVDKISVGYASEGKENSDVVGRLTLSLPAGSEERIAAFKGFANNHKPLTDEIEYHSWETPYLMTNLYKHLGRVGGVDMEVFAADSPEDRDWLGDRFNPENKIVITFFKPKPERDLN